MTRPPGFQTRIDAAPAGAAALVALALIVAIAVAAAHLLTALMEISR